MERTTVDKQELKQCQGKEVPRIALNLINQNYVKCSQSYTESTFPLLHTRSNFVNKRATKPVLH